MERVGPIVDRDVITPAMKRERAFGDAVRISADDRTELGAGLQIVSVGVAGEIVEA